MADKYRGWSPYNYCLNNPTVNYDPNGKFPWTIHALAFQQALHTDYLGPLIFNAVVDGPFYDVKSLHFDNYSTPSAVMSVIDEAGGFNNLNWHTMGDFYSHSNYVDIWAGLYANNDNMPTFQEIDWSSEFGQAVKAKLRCTDWKIPGSDYDHDEYAKDKPTVDSERLYKLAYDAYVRSLKIQNEESKKKRIVIDQHEEWILEFGVMSNE